MGWKKQQQVEHDIAMKGNNGENDGTNSLFDSENKSSRSHLKFMCIVILEIS